MCERIKEIKTPKLRNEANKLLVFNNTGHGVDLRPSANRKRRAVRTVPPEEVMTPQEPLPQSAINRTASL